MATEKDKVRRRVKSPKGTTGDISARLNLDTLEKLERLAALIPISKSGMAARAIEAWVAEHYHDELKRLGGK